MEVVEYKAIRLSKAQKTAIGAVMGSWRTVYKAIRHLDDSLPNLVILANMLAYELQTDAPRAQLITRIHMRINGMRQRMEYKMASAHAVVIPAPRPPPLKKPYKAGKKVPPRRVPPPVRAVQ